MVRRLQLQLTSKIQGWERLVWRLSSRSAARPDPFASLEDNMEEMMIDRNSIRAPKRVTSWVGALTLAVGLCAPIFGAQAHDESKYPNFGGQWKRPPGIGNQFDQTKAPREAQRVEFTPEYQKVFEENLKDQALGGQGTDPTFQCIPDGMPRAMNVIFPMETIITPNTTYMLIEYLDRKS